jgi:trimeric autotransporter adhesin
VCSLQVWLDVGSEKLEVQSEYASVVNRCIAELNTMAAAAQTTLAAAGANPQQQLRTVPCPPHLALSIARLLRRLTREVGADLAYHSTSRLVAITGDDLDKVEEAAVAVEKLCATEQGCSTKEEEAAAQKREAAAAKARAAEAAKAKAADAAAAAAVLAAATAAADKAHHGHAHAHSSSSSKHSSKDHKDKSSSSSDHHHHRDHRHGSGDSATTTAGAGALPPKGHRERGERGGRRSRPPLAPLRTESDTSNHEHEQSLGSGPPSYTPSESGSVGTMMRTAALDSSEGADSPRAASVSSSSAGGGCCCASPVVAEMLRNGSTDSLFTEGSAPWAGISFSFSSSSSSGSNSASSSSNDSSSGGAAAAATGGGPCWDYYRQSWADNGASEQELLLSCASEHELDLSSVSFVPPPVRGHVIAGSSSGNSGGAAAAANALMPPRPPALEPGLERAVFELLNALELAKYAPAFSNAEVRVIVCVLRLLDIIFDHTARICVCTVAVVLLIAELVVLQ